MSDTVRTATPRAAVPIEGLVDSHCHLDYPPMRDDIAGTLRRAREAGVVQLIHVGCSREHLAGAVELARAHASVFAAIGIHPHEATTADDEAMARLSELARTPKVVAIGETGLDFHYDRSPRDIQVAALLRHVTLARALDLPLVLHVRDAHDEAMALLRAHPGRDPMPGVVHCFTGNADQARRWLDLGYALSFSGIATFPSGGTIREAAVLCPAGRILLETDAPYLAPVPVRGRPNEPAHVAHTCAHLARIRGQEPAQLAQEAAATTRAIFHLPEPN